MSDRYSGFAPFSDKSAGLIIQSPKGLVQQACSERLPEHVPLSPPADAGGNIFLPEKPDNML